MRDRSEQPNYSRLEMGGIQRGDAAILDDSGEYIAFFHSSKEMATLLSQGATVPHYLMGAYDIFLAAAFPHHPRQS